MSRFRPRLRQLLGAGLLLAAAGSAGTTPAAASPYGSPVTVRPAISCPVPLVGGGATSLVVQFVSWSASPPGDFPSQASFTATLPGLGQALAGLGVKTAATSGTWRWNITSGGSNRLADQSFTVPSFAPSASVPDPVLAGTAAIPGTAAAGTDYVFSLDGLSFTFRGTDAGGQPVDFGSVPDGDGDDSALTITCTGSRAVIGRLSTVQGMTPPAVRIVDTTQRTATVSVFGGTMSGTSFRIFLDGREVASASQSSSTPPAPIVLDGLAPGRTYTVTATAFHPWFGTSALSEPVSFTTWTEGIPVPPAPKLGAAVAGESTVTVPIENPSAGTDYIALLDGVAVEGFAAEDDETITSLSIGNLEPATTYRLTAQALGKLALSEESAPLTFTTLALPVPPPTRLVAASGPAAYGVRGARLTGTAVSAASVGGELDLTTGAFTGTASLGSAKGSFKAFGVLPVQATLTFTGIGATTGRTTGAAFSLATTQDIAISKTKFVGLTIASGTCHTAAPPTITLGGPATALTDGGVLQGSFALGRLKDCSTFGDLTGTNGGNATLSMRLQPTPPPTT